MREILLGRDTDRAVWLVPGAQIEKKCKIAGQTLGVVDPERARRPQCRDFGRRRPDLHARIAVRFLDQFAQFNLVEPAQQRGPVVPCGTCGKLLQKAEPRGSGFGRLPGGKDLVVNIRRPSARSLWLTSTEPRSRWTE